MFKIFVFLRLHLGQSLECLQKSIFLHLLKTCITSILNGSINDSEFDTMALFNIQIPRTLNAVETKILNPRNTWSNANSYDKAAKKLALMYIENFKKYLTLESEYDFTHAGPKV